VVAWSRGRVVAWSRGRVSRVAWSRGRVVAWSRGRVVAWLRGRVVACRVSRGRVSRVACRVVAWSRGRVVAWLRGRVVVRSRVVAYTRDATPGCPQDRRRPLTRRLKQRREVAVGIVELIAACGLSSWPRTGGTRTHMTALRLTDRMRRRDAQWTADGGVALNGPRVAALCSTARRRRRNARRTAASAPPNQRTYASAPLDRDTHPAPRPSARISPTCYLFRSTLHVSTQRAEPPDDVHVASRRRAKVRLPYSSCPISPLRFRAPRAASTSTQNRLPRRCC